MCSQVEIAPVSTGPEAVAGTESPHGGAWFVAFAPEFTFAPPWTTVIEVGAHDGARDGAFWRLTLRDHANVEVRVLWVTEQVLLVEVWWGRTVSSELLIDVRRAELVHATTYAWFGTVDRGTHAGNSARGSVAR